MFLHPALNINFDLSKMFILAILAQEQDLILLARFLIKLVFQIILNFLMFS